MDNGSGSITGALTKTYTTFSGVDITAMFDDMTISTLQGVAISITREKVPIYRLGSANVCSISRGKRGIAGSLQFILFDRDAMNQLIRDEFHWYYAHADEVNWLLNTYNPANRYTEAWTANHGGLTPAGGIDRDNPPTDIFTPPANFDASSAVTGNTMVYEDAPGHVKSMAYSIRRMAQYMDQVYPFDINLVAQNEYGNGSYSAIIGVEIINEGGGLSIDDLSNETTATYIAQHRVNWTPVEDGRQAGNTFYGVSGVNMRADGTISADIIAGGAQP